MPTPTNDEREDDFFRRCMRDPEANTSHPDPAARYSFCQVQWENRSVNDDQKTIALLEAATKRASGQKFGYGITTADRYVRHAIDTCGSQFPDLGDRDAVLKRASETLTFCDPGCVLEKRAVSDMQALLPKGVKTPENTLMVLQHVITTPREDRDTDILVTEGAMLDPKAPLLWQHMHTFPIGKVLATIDHTKDVLRVATALLDINEMTADAAKLIEADVLRFSHGFRALEWEERKDKDGNPIYGFKVLKFEVMEVSLVSVPSNVDAEIELFAAGKLASPQFKAHAKALFDARTKQAPGVELESAPAKKAPEPEPKTKEPEPKTKEPEGPATDEKRGRVLSARNVNAINETISDLDELKTSDELSRAQKALVSKSIGRLKQVLKDAGGDDEEAAAPASKGAEEEAEPLTVDDAMAFVLREADPDQQDRFASSLRALRAVRDGDAKAANYRQAVGVS